MFTSTPVKTANPLNTSATGLLRRRDLASRWMLSTETLKRREKSGDLPFMKLGSSVRYRLADIEAIEQQALVRHS